MLCYLKVACTVQKAIFRMFSMHFYRHALDARRSVKCGMASVMWCDVTANHRRAAHSIPHFTFRIPHAAVPHFTRSRLRNTMTLCDVFQQLRCCSICSGMMPSTSTVGIRYVMSQTFSCHSMMRLVRFLGLDRLLALLQCWS